MAAKSIRRGLLVGLTAGALAVTTVPASSASTGTDGTTDTARKNAAATRQQQQQQQLLLIGMIFAPVSALTQGTADAVVAENTKSRAAKKAGKKAGKSRAARNNAAKDRPAEDDVSESVTESITTSTTSTGGTTTRASAASKATTGDDALSTTVKTAVAQPRRQQQTATLTARRGSQVIRCVVDISDPHRVDLMRERMVRVAAAVRCNRRVDGLRIRVQPLREGTVATASKSNVDSRSISLSAARGCVSNSTYRGRVRAQVDFPDGYRSSQSSVTVHSGAVHIAECR